MKKKYFVTNGQSRRLWMVIDSDGDGPAHVHVSGTIGESWYDATGNTHEQFKEAISAIPAGKKIHLHVNSKGGSVQDGLGMYATIAARAADVTCIIEGYACSIASVFPLAASKVVSPKSAIWMIHNASCGTYGDSEEHRKGSEMLKKHDETLVNIYHDRTGKSKKEIRDAMDNETWMTSDEAIVFGLADSDGSEDGIQDCVIEPLTVSDYKNAPKNLVLNSVNQSVANAPGKQETTMDKKAILALLKTHGIELAADATEHQVLDALAGLTKTKPTASTDVTSALAAQVNALVAQLDAEKRVRITARVNTCVTDCKIPKASAAAWIDRAMKDETVITDLEAMPVNAPGGNPVDHVIETTHESPLAEIKAKFKGTKMATARYAHLREEWSPLMQDARARDTRNRSQVFAANTYSASLVTQFLLDGAVTKLQNRWAALKVFTRDYSVDRYKPRATAQLKYVTSGATTLSSVGAPITNFEQGDSTVGNIQVAVNHYSQPFHVTDDELNSGLRMENLVEVNTSILADAIIQAATAPITAANFNTFANIVSAPDAFSWSDMQKAWGNIKKSPIHNALLDGEYLARIINVPTQFQKTGVEPGAAWAEFGWDNIALNTNWTGAGANVRGFYCNPQAIGAVAGLPLVPPTIPGATLQENSTVIPGPDISIADYTWFSLQGRTMWCSFDLMFGASLIDGTAGGLITSA